MFPLVLLPALDSPDLFAFDLCGLLDLLGQAPVLVDAADLGHVLVALHQRPVVFELLALAGGFDALALRGAGAPEADVAVVAAAEDVVVVRGPGGGKDALHAFCVVDVSAVALVAGPEADAAVVGGRDQFFARGGELDVHDGGDVVFEDVEGALEVAHVEDVDVVVFVCDGEIKSFHGVPGDCVAGEGQDALVQGRRGAHVVEDEGAVGGGRGEDGGFGLVELAGGDCVDAVGPLQRLQRRRVWPVEVVDADDG